MNGIGVPQAVYLLYLVKLIVFTFGGLLLISATSDLREGEIVAGVMLGYNFGDGHVHDYRLLAAVQERCGYEPGDLRIVTLESQPAHLGTQRYRIFDACDGLVEEGTVEVRDMVVRQPWLGGSDPFPVRVSHE